MQSTDAQLKAAQEKIEQFNEKKKEILAGIQQQIDAETEALA